MKVAIINKETLRIASWYDGNAPKDKGGEWGDPNKFEHIVWESLDTDGVEALRDPGSDEISLQVNASVQNTIRMEALRIQRDAKLKQSDWTQMPDSPLSVGVKNAWAAYRQELRDMPENIEDLANPMWPTEPVEP